MASKPGGLFRHDLDLGSDQVAGADEAGRGCLAGPIVAAAVLLDRNCLESEGTGRLSDIRDSKKLTAKARKAFKDSKKRKVIRKRGKKRIKRVKVPGLRKTAAKVTVRGFGAPGTTKLTIKRNGKVR